MKKQFFRVKQLADQTFSRAGKTEVLSDDLQAADRRVEFIKAACQNTTKKLVSSFLSQGQDAASREKRLKKSAEYQLGMSMLENGSLEEDCLLRQIITECGKLEILLANAMVDYETTVEQSVVNPLQLILENDHPNIMKHKRNLAKLILDMDSARTRYQTAVKQHASSGNSAASNKADSIKDELEDAEFKVEQCRDLLASEMFQLIAREAELAKTILEFVKIQKHYHETALATLDEMIPELENTISGSCIKPVFGCALEEHLRVTERKIAYPIELCVCALLELGMEEEGLFRVAGGASKVRRMKLSLDASCMTLETALEYRDPHVIAGVLKSYLRELPEPLLTHKLHDQWMNAARMQGSNDARLQAIWTVVQKLPAANHDNLRYIIKFLSALTKNQEANKMTSQNIAIVMAPNLIWSPDSDGTNIGLNMNVASLHSIMVDCLINYADWFFPGEEEFYVTLDAGLIPPRTLVNGHVRSNSGDTQIIITSDSVSSNPSAGAGDIKRSRSIDSLNDPNSPPLGSPRPAMRNRKMKPVAPVPPNMQAKESQPIVNQSQSSSSKVESLSQSTLSPPIGFERFQTRAIPDPGESDSPKKSMEKIEQEKSVSDNKQSEKAKCDILVDSDNSDVMTRSLDLSAFSRKNHEMNSTSSNNNNESKADSNLVSRSQSIRKSSGPNAEGPKSSTELIYGTFERKRLSRPTPAPRTSLETGEGATKPAIPERPAALQRPLSSSFRIIRPGDGSEGEVCLLERTHLYQTDKPLTATVQDSTGKNEVESSASKKISNYENVTLIGNRPRPASMSIADRKDIDKPDKPPKPDLLTDKSAPALSRAHSDGSSIDAVPAPAGKTPMTRFTRPTPPPPPPPSSSVKREGSLSESTDL
ncbi:unnamed protein product [Bemisia tabaci]|uniref:Rho GTPase-activating protein 44 n=1 Tax=Bemisia tabaci TaxID=7038 RepID=A0A9P0F4T1_BEMTA|nr:PREDICTED: rho GTPase-activating protein 44-like [Bemisia tabaci]CAH0388088.1 unnamed protein product [Bemisia tabaci]